MEIAAEKVELHPKAQYLPPTVNSCLGLVHSKESLPLEQETTQDIPRQQARWGNKSSSRQHLKLNKYQFLKGQSSYFQ